MAGEEKKSKKVDANEVQKIAKLSKINLHGVELDKLTKDFNQILNFVKAIDEVNTDNIPQMKHIMKYSQTLRKDEPKDSLNIETIKKVAPKFTAGYFVVPRVIEHDG